MKKTLFFIIWFVLLIIGVVSVVIGTNWNLTAGTILDLANIAFKISLVIAFFNLFAYLALNIKIAKVLSYLFIFISLLLILAMRYLGGYGADPFYTFTQVCALCESPYEYYLTLGRVSFWLAATVLIWKKLEDLNYLIFLLIGAQIYYMAQEIRSFPFIVFAAIAYLIVLYLIVFKKLPEYYRTFRAWLAY